jgi:sensor histidine kinase YesM
LILEGDNDRADRLVSKLSAFLRQSLVSQPGEMVTVDQEFAANLNYLDIEMVRFGERLNVDVHIDEGAHHARVPSLMLQPLVENAVKYAIAPSEDGGTISLQALARRGRLILRVDDDGPGLPTEVRRSGHDPASCGVGLANTAERLIHIYGEEHQFEVGDRPGGGTRVEIAIPLTTDSSEVNP